MQYLVFDIGGTTIKEALVVDGEIQDRKTASTPDSYEELVTHLRLSQKKSGADAVCLLVPGVYDKVRDQILMAPNISYLAGKRPQAGFNFSVPLLIENDANMAAFGEYHYGFDEKPSSLIFLTVGTGIGGGFVTEGKLFTGNITNFEPGHITLTENGRLCACGRKGCFERYVSVRGIVENYEERSGSSRSFTDIVKLAREGEESALEAFSSFAKSFAHGLASLINLYAPEQVRVGGGLSELGDLYFKRMRALARKYTFPAFSGITEIELSALINDAALLGAAKWAELTLGKR